MAMVMVVRLWLCGYCDATVVLPPRPPPVRLDQLVAAGFEGPQLRGAGASVAELRAVGFTDTEVLPQPGFAHCRC